jgi:hypothetical protein
MSLNTATNYDYLIDALRLHLGDTNPASYRYLDEWLRTALMYSIKTLQRWWNYKYLIDSNYDIYRNPNISFLFPEPPIIQTVDERPIVLMASIIIKQGALENSSWATGSWKDYEISYSNIESGKMKEFSLKSDWDELTSLIKQPSKRLAWTEKGHLPGWTSPGYEKDTIP